MACALAVMAFASGCSWRAQKSELSATQGSIDKRITRQVESNLASSPVYKYEGVRVQTFDGIVQLSGFVSTQEQKDRAGQLAQDIQGVKRVDNVLALKPQGDQRTLAPTGWTQGQGQNVIYPHGQTQPEKESEGKPADVNNPNSRQ